MLNVVQEHPILLTGTYLILLKEDPPYNAAAFKILVLFPEDYPFKEFKVRFLTDIYNPAVAGDGKMMRCPCALGVRPGRWSQYCTLEKGQ